MKQAIVDLQNKKAGEFEFSECVFTDSPNIALIYENVKMQFANRRSGTASTKNVAEVSGSTAKIYRQKGTGRARHGSAKRNIFVGGAISHGPRPRDFSYRLPRKVRRSGLKAALSLKKIKDKIIVVKDFDLKEIKTRAMVLVLSKLGVREALLVTHEPNEKLEKSVRNLPYVKLLRWEGLNVADLMRYEHLVISANALAKVQEVYQS